MSTIQHTKVYKISGSVTLISFLVLVVVLATSSTTSEVNHVAGFVGVTSICLFCSSFVIWLFESSKHDTRVVLERKMTEKTKQIERHSEFMDLPNDERQLELQNYMQDVRKAQNLASWSYLGIIIPLLGWILAGMSLSTLKSIPNWISPSLNKHKQLVNKSASVSIMISIIVVAIYLLIAVTKPPIQSGSESTTVNQTPPYTSVPTTVTPSVGPSGGPLNTAAKQACRSDQTGAYPSCMTPAPTLNCSGIDTGSYYSYSCNDQSSKIFCTGSIIGSVASNTCDYQKGAPYTCVNHSIGSVINITCTGTAYLDNQAY